MYFIKVSNYYGAWKAGIIDAVDGGGNLTGSKAIAQAKRNHKGRGLTRSEWSVVEQSEYQTLSGNLDADYPVTKGS